MFVFEGQNKLTTFAWLLGYSRNDFDQRFVMVDEEYPGVVGLNVARGILSEEEVEQGALYLQSVLICVLLWRRQCTI